MRYGAIFIGVVFSALSLADTLVCNVTSMIPSDPNLVAAQLIIDTRVKSSLDGSVSSVDLKTFMSDESVKSVRIFGYNPWIRGVLVPDIFLCDRSNERSQYRQQFGQVRLWSNCRVPDSINGRIKLRASLDTSNSGSFDYSYPESDTVQSVEIRTSQCSKIE